MQHIDATIEAQRAGNTPSGSRVLLVCHARRARRAQGIGAALLAALSVNVEARAAEPEASAEAAPHSGFLSEIHFAAGGASLTYDESDSPVADFAALTLACALRLGGFLGPHVALGAELAATWGAGVGPLHVRDRSYFYDDYPRGSTFGYFAPIGVFLELYPMQGDGVFFGASAGIGLMELPELSQASGGLMSRWGLELGYTFGRGASYLRYEHWQGAELPIATDYPDGLSSDGLLLGARWSF
jgi:hypothetical protein